MFARHKAFIWETSLSEDGLSSINNPDPIALSELIGYETERAKAIENTVQFLKGFPADNVQEKLSLSDRFGISITFSSPTKIKYLQIVDSIAEKRNLKIDKEKSHAEALKWEMWYNGRSPRTAKQFIDWIEGE